MFSSTCKDLLVHIFLFLFKLFVVCSLGWVIRRCVVFQVWRFLWFLFASVRSHGVMVSTLDFESSDPSSNLGGTSEAFLLLYFIFNLKSRRYVHALLENKTQNVKWQNKLKSSLLLKTARKTLRDVGVKKYLSVKSKLFTPTWSFWTPHAVVVVIFTRLSIGSEKELGLN